MISKLPRWVWAGTWFLAFIAGIVNVVGLLGFGHETITHLTGNTSRLAESMAKLDMSATLHLTSLMGAFFLGTVISGLLIKDSALQINGKYGIVLMFESLLLFASVPLLKRHNLCGVYAAACAIGLQNAMASTYSGAVVRTAHISGMFTDLGVSLGHALRGIPVNMKRISLCIVVISGFLCGGIFGALTFQALNYSVLLFPAVLTAIVSIAYGLYQIKSETLGSQWKRGWRLVVIVFVVFYLTLFIVVPYGLQVLGYDVTTHKFFNMIPGNWEWELLK